MAVDEEKEDKRHKNCPKDSANTEPTTSYVPEVMQ
jgi:hypothetical protein